MDMPKTLYKDRIHADKVYTGFEWSLCDWSLLFEHYKMGVKSPEFMLTEMEGLKCQLEFNWNYPLTGRKAYSSLRIKFLNELELCGMQVTVSVVNNRSQKLNEFHKYSKSVFNCWEIPLDDYGQTAFLNYLQNDALIFFVEITIVKSIKNGPSTTEVWNAGLRPEVRAKFVDFYLKGDMCDVTFIIENKKFNAHKIILAANSQFFREKFTMEMRDQSEVTIEVWECATTFEAFLRYMYTGQVENIQNVVVKLIRMAFKYDVLDLKDICESFMSDDLNSGNVIDYLLAASELSCTNLQKKAVDYVRANMHLLGNASVLTQLVSKPNLIAEVFDTRSAA